jgi:hypothetical protein
MAELGEGRASGTAAPGGRLQVAAKWVHREYVNKKRGEGSVSCSQQILDRQARRGNSINNGHLCEIMISVRDLLALGTMKSR